MSTQAPDDRFFEWLDGGVPPLPLGDALDVLYASRPPTSLTARALEKVRARLDAARPNALYYDTLEDTPLGPLHIAVSDQGIVALNFGRPQEGFLRWLERRTGLKPVQDPGRVAPVARQVREYLAGKRRRFDVAVDLRLMTEFQRRVLLRVAQVSAGEIATYGQVARWLGKPRAARAVGQALARNPIPLVIPCHRVLASDGSLGGYSGGDGLPTKRRLLQMEGAHLPMRQAGA